MFWLVVVWRLLFSAPMNEPPPHGTLCAMPPLNVLVLADDRRAGRSLPASVELAGVVVDCAESVEVSDGW